MNNHLTEDITMPYIILLLMPLLMGIVACEDSITSANSEEFTSSSTTTLQELNGGDSVVYIRLDRGRFSSSDTYLESSSSYVNDSDFKKICVGVLNELLDYSTLSVERPEELCASEKNALQFVGFLNGEIQRCFQLMDTYCLGLQEKSNGSSNCCKISMEYDNDFKMRLCNAKKLKGEAGFVDCDCSCVE